jgi:4-hydroxy-3-polyprenylbenzoate decarboxylase
VIAVRAKSFNDYESAQKELNSLSEQLQDHVKELDTAPLIIVCDDSSFVCKTLNNFLWVTFTRSNPSHDVYGVRSSTRFKHWGCNGPLVIDARIKPHHAPPLESDPAIEKRVDRLFNKGGSLYGIIK